jgi:hypothetical protein
LATRYASKPGFNPLSTMSISFAIFAFDALRVCTKTSKI